jgi:hypothetical protein
MSDFNIMPETFSDDFADDASLRGQGTIAYVDEAGLSQGVMEAVKVHQDISNAIETWTRSLSPTAATNRPNYDLFKRSQYNSVDNIFRIIELCSAAVENDDVLSGLADVSEGIAIQKMKFEMHDEDQQDIWNQIARDLDLDSRLREIWRELFKASQVYIAVEWDNRIYKVRTKPDLQEKRSSILGKARSSGGNRNRKKEYRIVCPTGLSVLDPVKVVPVGNLMFGRERFAYIADRGEEEGIASAIAGEVVDDMVMRLIERKYRPTEAERKNLAEMGVAPERLWLFKPQAVFRHTMTRSQYERFAVPRLKSILPLIDMKQHLREADRAALLGNTNFIVVIRKGTDKLPARPKELEALHEQARVIARVPVIIGDHRLSVDIVAPPMDNTLDEARYNTLDARLVFRALGSFAPASGGGGSLGGGGSQIKEVSLVVSRGFENRRHQLGRSLEKALFRLTVDINDELTEMPSLTFLPRRISLDVNQDIVNAVLKLRDRGELSRGTALEELDYDQEIEAIRRVREEEEYDDIFLTHVPFDAPANGPAQKKSAPNDVEGGRPKGSRTQKKAGDA